MENSRCICKQRGGDKVGEDQKMKGDGDKVITIVKKDFNARIEKRGKR